MADTTLHDVLVIGAGPTGMACAIAAQREGLDVVLVDKGCLTNSLFHYPAHMTFFTTPELLEIGNMPFSSPNQKPTRAEALEYYRKVADHYALDVRLYERVDGVEGSDGNFRVQTTDRFERVNVHRARKIIVSTGYYDLPNHLRIPGEDLRKVNHYYNEPHPFFDQDVVVIGGKNSAAIAALDLWRHGARVTLVHRGAELHRHIKYWIKPDIENRIKNGEIAAFFEQRRWRTLPRMTVTLNGRQDGERMFPNDLCLRAHRISARLCKFIENAGRSPRSEQRPLPHLQTGHAGVECCRVSMWRVWSLRASAPTRSSLRTGRFHGDLIAGGPRGEVWPRRTRAAGGTAAHGGGGVTESEAGTVVAASIMPWLRRWSELQIPPLRYGMTNTGLAGRHAAALKRQTGFGAEVHLTERSSN